MNIEEIDKWLKDQYGISYTEMSNEFNSASELLSKKIKEIERLNNNKDNAINFIDQVLMYHLHDYKQLDEDINTLIGILRGSDKE